MRWLLCGLGQPVSAGDSQYTVAVDDGFARVHFPDLEAPRVASEERWEELGYDAVPFPWHEGPPVADTRPDLAELRRALEAEEVERYRSIGRDAARILADTLAALRPQSTELAVAGELAGRFRAQGFTTPVVLVGGERRMRIYRHPLPTGEQLGASVLIGVTVERAGLHVSLSRVASFGPAPAALREAVRAAVAVEAAVLRASKPGETLGSLFDVIAGAYAEQGLEGEWRRHHQGGITGYRGREAFARPGDATPLPEVCAVAFNPTVTGGGKSENTAIVTAGGVEILTATPELGAIAELPLR